MRILLVEDNIDFAGSIEKAIIRIGGCDVTWRRSKAGALAALDEEYFDVVLLDRRIPTEDDYLDDHQDHGWAVFQAIVKQLPGTSVWFLTGTVDPDFPVNVLNLHGYRGDIHCCGREDTLYRVFWKDKMPECITAVSEFRADVQQTDAIHLSFVGQQTNLRSEETRLLKLFGRTHGGARIEIRPLTDGLSGTKVLRVTAFDAAGVPKITSVAKIGQADDMAVERDKYHSQVVKLRPGSFPQITAEIELGAGGFAGIFFGVVGTEVKNLFDLLIEDPTEGATIPNVIRDDQAIWHGPRQIEMLPVSTIRRSLVSDVVLLSLSDEFAGIDINSVESVEVNAARCIQHGDLHCANVLFDNTFRPMVIDYPEIEHTFASLDPIVLELSTIFHRNAPKDRAGWPSQGQAEKWTNIEQFCADSPYYAYLRTCRDWAAAMAGSEQEIWAVGYSYAIRQLKYDDTNKILALAIIRGCISRLLESDEV